jgi:hypothetical protein
MQRPSNQTAKRVKARNRRLEKLKRPARVEFTPGLRSDLRQIRPDRPQALRLNTQERVAFIHRLVNGNADLGDTSGRRGDDGHEHFHRLDGDQFLVERDLVADRNIDFSDPAGPTRDDIHDTAFR